ncbi:hypothetical protein C8R46DRAFT_1050729 [Mycena filopes]|nr:hypothetical protein C8R46DRAFT_1050729 [Mycena filopes]
MTESKKAKKARLAAEELERKQRAEEGDASRPENQSSPLATPRGRARSKSPENSHDGGVAPSSTKDEREQQAQESASRAAQTTTPPPHSSPLPPLTPSGIEPVELTFTSGRYHQRRKRILADFTTTPAPTNVRMERRPTLGARAMACHGKCRCSAMNPRPRCLPPVRRRRRRQDKKRRARVDLEESDDLREAIRRSRMDFDFDMSSEEEVRSTLWDDKNLKAAREHLARERAIHENTAEFKSRHDAWRRSEQVLREGRIREDYDYAADVQAQFAQADADRELAERIFNEEQARIAQRQERLDAANEALSRRWGRMKKSEQGHEKGDGKVRTTSNTVPKRERSRSRPNPPLSSSPLPPSASNRHTHKFPDRVVLQKYRRDEMEKYGASRIEDQGIEWDKHGQPFDARPVPSRGSSVGTRGGRRTSHSAAHENERKSPKSKTAPHDARETAAKDEPEEAKKFTQDKKGQRSSESTKRESPSTSKLQADGARGGGGGKPPHRPSRASGPGDPDDSDTSSSSSEASWAPKDEKKKRKKKYKKRYSSEDSTSEPNEGASAAEETDSAWERDPLDVISNAYSSGKKGPLPSDEDRKPHRHAAQGGSGGNPDEPSSSSSSSSDEQKPNKGPSKTPRKRPNESDRDRKRRHTRNSRRKHHKRGRRDDENARKTTEKMAAIAA